jgi:voltage-gated potassium channel
MTFRERTWKILAVAEPGDTPSRVFDIFILVLIFANVVAVIVGTVESVYDPWSRFFDWFEIFSVIVFTVEYVGRLWSCVSDPRYKNRVGGRLKFARQALSIIDLIAVLPFYLPFLGVDLRFVRIFRIVRILRLAKVGRYYSSLTLIRDTAKSRKEELVLSFAILLTLLLIAATGIYYCENEAQPETFSSIPGSLWWAVVTLTTVGYGDAYPVTVVGKFFASLVAIVGIGMFALPTGILGAGFVEEIRRRKANSDPGRCPHCGKSLNRD